jgi:hypothetical protein
MRRLSQIAADCGGQLIGEDSPWSSASIDTRRIAAGELFIFLMLLLHGPAAAGLAAAGEGCVGSMRTSRRWTSRSHSATGQGKRSQ